MKNLLLLIIAFSTLASCKSDTKKVVEDIEETTQIDAPQLDIYSDVFVNEVPTGLLIFHENSGDVVMYQFCNKDSYRKFAMHSKNVKVMLDFGKHEINIIDANGKTLNTYGSKFITDRGVEFQGMSLRSGWIQDKSQITAQNIANLSKEFINQLTCRCLPDSGLDCQGNKIESVNCPMGGEGTTSCSSTEKSINKYITLGNNYAKGVKDFCQVSCNKEAKFSACCGVGE